MNKVILIGRLGKDPEVRSTRDGKAVTNISLCTSEAKDQVEWHRVTLWEKAAETAATYLKKGSQIAVEGKLQMRKWNDKQGVEHYSTEIQASRFEFCGKKEDDGPPKATQPRPAAAHYPQNDPGAYHDTGSYAQQPPLNMDDIPF